VRPIFANTAVRAANTAANNAQKNHVRRVRTRQIPA
jgi:hypothetical protein